MKSLTALMLAGLIVLLCMAPPVLAAERLAGATSPYLLLHEDDPVDWWPWGPAALAEAQRLDRPILLSIGYLACHWCHVMQDENFTDPNIAATMNESFVNILVDREERPDIDTLYQEAAVLMGLPAAGVDRGQPVAPLYPRRAARRDGDNRGSRLAGPCRADPVRGHGRGPMPAPTRPRRWPIGTSGAAGSFRSPPMRTQRCRR